MREQERVMVRQAVRQAGPALLRIARPRCERAVADGLPVIVARGAVTHPVGRLHRLIAAVSGAYDPVRRVVCAMQATRLSFRDCGGGTV